MHVYLHEKRMFLLHRFDSYVGLSIRLQQLFIFFFPISRWPLPQLPPAKICVLDTCVI